MSVFELFLLAVGLSMDAFAVSVCKGLSAPDVKPRHMAIAGAWFGGFQALMPAIGYFLGSAFARYITSIDHWIAFVLLGIIGGNMIREALSGEEEKTDASFGVRTMFLMAIATSIDALAVGITFAFLIDSAVYLLLAVLFIGCTTFLLSAAGVKIGSVFGAKYKARAEFAGGCILVLLGVKILLEGLNIL